jgi:hypothetical protein
MRSIKSKSPWILGTAILALAGMSLQAEAAPRGRDRDRWDRRDNRWDRRDSRWDKRRDNDRWDRRDDRRDGRWDRRDNRRPFPHYRYKSNNGNHYGHRNR